MNFTVLPCSHTSILIALANLAVKHKKYLPVTPPNKDYLNRFLSNIFISEHNSSNITIELKNNKGTFHCNLKNIDVAVYGNGDISFYLHTDCGVFVIEALSSRLTKSLLAELLLIINNAYNLYLDGVAQQINDDVFKLTTKDKLVNSNSHYYIDVSKFEQIDYYVIATLYGIHDPCIQHTLKKLLALGQRSGGKSQRKDIEECILQLQRKLEIDEVLGEN